MAIARESWRSVFGRVLPGILLASAVLSGGCNPRVTDSVVVRTDAARVAEALARDGGKGVLLLDSRPRSDFEAASIPGAFNVRLSDIDDTRRDGRLEGHSQIIVYGQNPGSGAAIAIAKRLLALRFENVVLFEGGLDAWQAGGYPTAPGRRFGLPDRRN